MAEQVLLSYGMGVESSAILTRWAHEPKARPCALDRLIVITSQVGDEYRDTARDVEGLGAKPDSSWEYEMHGTTGKHQGIVHRGFWSDLREATASRKLYNQILGIGFKEENDGYLHTEALKGANSFPLWPLSQPAQSCFGKDSWPQEIPTPQAWLEFDVDSVEKATEELESQGHRMLVKSEGTVGPNCQSFHHSRRIVGRNHFYSINARREIVSAIPGARRSRHDVFSSSHPFGRIVGSLSNASAFRPD